jgi:MFS transporter, DHA1 family, multidrug resistance protein
VPGDKIDVLVSPLIVDQAEPGSRGEAMGLYNASFFGALALGPLLGGVLYDLWGVEAPFLLWGGLGALSLFVVLFRVSEPENSMVRMG